MLACRNLGYLSNDLLTLDPTYGRGNWWSLWQPRQLIAHDIVHDGIDFRCLPEDDESLEAAVFDPPYIATGGRTTSTIPEFNSRYGLVHAPRTPLELHYMNSLGLREIQRVVRPGSYILVKSMNYVSSGKLQPGTFWIQQSAFLMGLELADEFHHLGEPGPQPKRSRADGAPVRQHHARRNYSTLSVFLKPKKVR